MRTVDELLVDRIICEKDQAANISSEVALLLNEAFNTNIFEGSIKDVDGNTCAVSYRFKDDAKPADLLRVELGIAERVEWSTMGFWA